MNATTTKMPHTIPAMKIPDTTEQPNEHKAKKQAAREINNLIPFLRHISNRIPFSEAREKLRTNGLD